MSRATILVADDDLGIARTMKELLEAYGCVVATASDGLEALERIEAGDFDAVLSDVVMPNMDGYELYTTLHRTHPKLPVLLMTAFTYDKDHPNSGYRYMKPPKKPAKKKAAEKKSG